MLFGKKKFLGKFLKARVKNENLEKLKKRPCKAKNPD